MEEWRHAFGMRCLKIPNTAHFKEITKIEDWDMAVQNCLRNAEQLWCPVLTTSSQEAITLYEKLKRDAEEQTFRPDQAGSNDSMPDSHLVDFEALGDQRDFC